MLRNAIAVIKILTFITLLFTSFKSFSASVMALDYGYSKIDYEPMSAKNVTPMGPGFGVSIGTRNGLVGTEFYYRNLTASGDYIHDSVTGQFEHKQSSFGAGVQVYLTKQLFLRFGYGFSRIEQTNQTLQESYRNQQIASTYGLIDKSTGSGPNYGIGYNFFDGKRWDVFALFNRDHIYDGATEMRVSVGIKFYFKLGLRSAFTK